MFPRGSEMADQFPIGAEAAKGQVCEDGEISTSY